VAGKLQDLHRAAHMGVHRGWLTGRWLAAATPFNHLPEGPVRGLLAPTLQGRCAAISITSTTTATGRAHAAAIL